MVKSTTSFETLQKIADWMVECDIGYSTLSGLVSHFEILYHRDNTLYACVLAKKHREKGFGKGVWDRWRQIMDGEWGTLDYATTHYQGQAVEHIEWTDSMDKRYFLNNHGSAYEEWLETAGDEAAHLKKQWERVKEDLMAHKCERKKLQVRIRKDYPTRGEVRSNLWVLCVHRFHINPILVQSLEATCLPWCRFVCAVANKSSWKSTAICPLTWVRE